MLRSVGICKNCAFLTGIMPSIPKVVGSNHTQNSVLLFDSDHNHNVLFVVCWLIHHSQHSHADSIASGQRLIRCKLYSQPDLSFQLYT